MTSNPAIIIMIRSHGAFPIVFDSTQTPPTNICNIVFDSTNQGKYPCKFYNITTAKLGGGCAGYNDVHYYQTVIRKVLSEKLLINTNYRSAELIEELFGNKNVFLQELNKVYHNTLESNEIPEFYITHSNFYLQKVYNFDANMIQGGNSGLKIIHFNNMTGQERDLFKNTCDFYNRELLNGINITKSNLMQSLFEAMAAIRKGESGHIYFMDFTCEAFVNFNSSYHLNDDDITWIKNTLKNTFGLEQILLSSIFTNNYNGRFLLLGGKKRRRSKKRKHSKKRRSRRY
jgi:hypothetical protein